MLTAAATLCAALPAQAQKQQVDMSVITCKQFFEYNKENLSLMLMWLDGYYSEDDAPRSSISTRWARTARSSASTAARIRATA